MAHPMRRLSASKEKVSSKNAPIVRPIRKPGGGNTYLDYVNVERCIHAVRLGKNTGVRRGFSGECLTRDINVLSGYGVFDLEDPELHPSPFGRRCFPNTDEAGELRKRWQIVQRYKRVEAARIETEERLRQLCPNIAMRSRCSEQPDMALAEQPQTDLAKHTQPSRKDSDMFAVPIKDLDTSATDQAIQETNNLSESQHSDRMLHLTTCDPVEIDSKPSEYISLGLHFTPPKTSGQEQHMPLLADPRDHSKEENQQFRLPAQRPNHSWGFYMMQIRESLLDSLSEGLDCFFGE